MKRFAKMAMFVTRGFASQSSIDFQATKTKETAKKIRAPHFQRAPRKRSGRAVSQDPRYGISPKAEELIKKVLRLPDVDEEVCKELDQWTLEGKFPIAYIKQAMQVFEREKQWKKLIQVSQWMLQKGEGKTLRTYEALLKALDMNRCPDQAEAVWKNEILKSSWSIPTRLVTYALSMFERHHKPLEVIRLFIKMQDSGRNLCKESIRTVARAYEQEGFLEMKKQVLLNHNIPLKDASKDSESETEQE
ncbi:hypothetical protein GOP47_0001632 [Adiantum capillus-veneris]|uniref:Pentatricopeptide repeat-containing protein n=1 Tax=Adiantum capillus-veneris TaxID=13818 RepID=A0A9D4V9B7_ADICA|nr:hypothetical protein GOP47_0001632 [Adiantum capillus-veneris]